MAGFREVSVRLADGSTEVGYFKQREMPEPSSLEIGVEVMVGQRVSFIGSNSEFEVANASWQRLAKWCHADLIPPKPRRLTGPTPAPVEPPIGVSEVEAPAPGATPPEPVAAAEPEAKVDDQVDEPEQKDTPDGE